MRLNEWTKLCHSCAHLKGFWPDDVNVGEKLMLIVSEVAEAMEAYRRGEPIDEEIADVVIRLFDFCGYYKIDLEKEMRKKLKINLERLHKHGKRC